MNLRAYVPLGGLLILAWMGGPRSSEGAGVGVQAQAASEPVVLERQVETDPCEGDGIGNDPTADLDQDGVPDLEEGSGDSDGDGFPDVCDPDDDNDGLPTRLEESVDVNGDGRYDTDVDGDSVPNRLDLDSDGDGFSDCNEWLNDADHDGVPDYLDSDQPGSADSVDGVDNIDTDECGSSTSSACSDPDAEPSYGDGEQPFFVGSGCSTSVNGPAGWGWILLPLLSLLCLARGKR